MRKILLAFDDKNFSDGAFEFAKKLNEKTPILLTGVFLPHLNYSNLWSYADGVGGPIFVPVLDDSESEEIDRNMQRFEDLCLKNSIEYRVRKDFVDLALPELKKETRFADLLIIGGESFYENMGTGEPNNYLKEALHGVECSVVVVPEKFEFPNINLLTYDGTDSSVFAIKQFAYLFPEFLNNKTILVYANDKERDSIPDEPYIEELASRHFGDLTVTKLDVNPKKSFATWISEKKGSVIISGSFGRSSISRLFKKSFITDVIKDHRLPVFIAHR